MKTRQCFLAVEEKKKKEKKKKVLYCRSITLVLLAINQCNLRMENYWWLVSKALAALPPDPEHRGARGAGFSHWQAAEPQQALGAGALAMGFHPPAVGAGAIWPISCIQRCLGSDSCAAACAPRALFHRELEGQDGVSLAKQCFSNAGRLLTPSPAHKIIPKLPVEPR